ncbi:MAG: DUF3108 domain-containing protein [Candidatus Neomarinimicrobiota bacterium]
MRLILLSLFFGVLSLNAQDYPFKVGEKLDYTAEFNNVPIGYASLSVDSMQIINNQKTYRIEFLARTGNFGDMFYKIRDHINVWLDKKDLFTHKIKKNIREGSYRKKIETIFDYEKMIAINGKDTTVILQNIVDPYSLFYLLRTVSLDEDSPMIFSTYENKKVKEIKFKVGTKAVINSPLGSFTCIPVKPFNVDRSLFKNQGSMKIWFSEDKRRLPVKIQIKLKFGSLTLLLKKISYE